jgi:hypothetical protein
MCRAQEAFIGVVVFSMLSLLNVGCQALLPVLCEEQLFLLTPA